MNIRAIDTSLVQDIDDLCSKLFEAETSAGTNSRANEWNQTSWSKVCEAGLPTILAEVGDGSFGWPEALPVLCALGRWQTCLPLAETILANHVLGNMLPLEKDAVITVSEQLVDCSPIGDSDRMTLTAELRNVPWANIASHMLVGLRSHSDGVHVAVVDLSSRNIQIIPGVNAAGESRSTVKLEAAEVRLFDAGLRLKSSLGLIQLLALIRSAMMIGAMEAAASLALSHANERVQFGRPIGKFQAIQQQLAEMVGYLSSAGTSVQVAFDSAEQRRRTSSSTADFDVAVAKVVCGQAALRVRAVTHQVLGAMGFTQEHALHLATTRLWAWRFEGGTESYWADLLGKSMVATGADGFWPAMVDRRLTLK